MYLLIKGIWKAVNMKVNGNIPQTLKLTQASWLCVLQIISFKIAKKIKKPIHLYINLFQPISSSLREPLKKILRKFFLKNTLPMNNVNAKIILIIVGFKYMKMGFWK